MIDPVTDTDIVGMAKEGQESKQGTPLLCSALKEDEDKGEEEAEHGTGRDGTGRRAECGRGWYGT